MSKPDLTPIKAIYKELSTCSCCGFTNGDMQYDAKQQIMEALTND